MQLEHVRKAVAKVLDGCTTLPIPVEAIVLSKGIRLLPYELGEGISGMLVIENGSATIGYNRSESKVRNRFTIAHELGHFELHKEQDLFIDKGFKVMMRSAQYNTYSDSQIKEREANVFAASLLMPEKLVKEEIEKFDIDITDESAIKVLAQKFGVSGLAMSYRISELQLF